MQPAKKGNAQNNNLRGRQGEQGPPGPRGLPGPRGIPGLSGIPGSPGTGLQFLGTTPLTPGKTYNPGDLISDASSGIVYICIKENTNLAAGRVDSDAAKPFWQLYSRGGVNGASVDFVGLYNPDISYNYYDTVNDTSGHYFLSIWNKENDTKLGPNKGQPLPQYDICGNYSLVNNAGVFILDASNKLQPSSYWKFYTRDGYTVNPTGGWNATTAYNYYDVATVTDASGRQTTYLSMVKGSKSNTGNDPLTSGIKFWTIYSQGGQNGTSIRFKGLWNSKTVYSANDVVKDSSDNSYISNLNDNSGNALPGFNESSYVFDVSNTYWDLLTKAGSTFNQRGRWYLDVSYNLYDVVSDNSGSTFISKWDNKPQDVNIGNALPIYDYRTDTYVDTKYWHFLVSNGFSITGTGFWDASRVYNLSDLATVVDDNSKNTVYISILKPGQGLINVRRNPVTDPSASTFWIKMTTDGQNGENGLGYKNRGTWSPDLSYNVQDVIYYNNSTYSCASGNINKVPPENSNFWLTFVDGLYSRGDWSNNNLLGDICYNTFDTVTFRNTQFTCASFNKSRTTPNSSPNPGYDTPYWKRYIQATYYAGQWASGGTYYYNDIAVFRSTSYQCVSGITSHKDPPTLGTTYWNPTTQGFENKGNWDPNTTYHVNDVVSHNNSIYSCASNNVQNVEPSSTLTVPKFWTVFSEGYNNRGFWNNGNTWRTPTTGPAGISYDLFDQVLFHNTQFTCASYNNSNNSVATPNPGFDTDYWEVYIPNIYYINTPWSASTPYYFNDSVTYNGTSYLCILGTPINNNGSPDMSTNYWSKTTQGVQFKGTWASNTYYGVQDMVTVNNSFYSCKLANTATASNKPPNTSFWNELITANNVRGDWSANNVKPDISYSIYDQVSFRNTQFLCISANIVTVANYKQVQPNPGYDTSYWKRYINATYYAGQWASGGTYYYNDIATFRSTSYQCVSGITSSLDPPTLGSTYWEATTQGFENKGNWDPSIVYHINDVVSYKNSVYSCASNNVKDKEPNAPDAVPDYWTVFSEGYYDRKLWNDGSWTLPFTGIGISYNLFDQVLFRGTKFTCASYNNSKDSRAVPNPGFDTDYWEVYIPNVYYIDSPWSSANRYYFNDSVTYNGTSYLCISGTPVNNNGSPDMSTNYWSKITQGVQFKGTWTSGTYYGVQDMVTVNNSFYTCKLANTSSTSNKPPNTTYWNALIIANNIRGDWSANNVTPDVSYSIYDQVSFRNTQFLCISANTVTTTNYKQVQPNPGYDTSYWKRYINATYYAGQWVSGGTYYYNDIATFRSTSYQCASGITSDKDPPTLGSTYWEATTQGFENKGTWDPSIVYHINDVVSWNNSIYSCASNNIKNITPSSTLTVPDYWTVFSEGYYDRKLWNDGSWALPVTGAGINYDLFDQVLFRGTKFTCASYNNSTTLAAVPNPGFDTDYWEVYINGPYNVPEIWSQGSKYYYNDVVTNTDLRFALGNWQCISGNSSAQITLSNSTYWTATGTQGTTGSDGQNGINSKGPFIKDKKYNITDIVQFHNSTFECISNITQSLDYSYNSRVYPSNDTSNNQPIPGLNTPYWINTILTNSYSSGTWTASGTYYKNDVVSINQYNPYTFTCNSFNTGFYPPSINSAPYWSIDQSNGNPTATSREWSSGLSYEFGHQVTFRNATFQCISNITQSIAYSSNYGPTDTRNNQPIPGINTPYWNYVTPASTNNSISPYWSSSTTYYVKDVVSLGPNSQYTFTCLSFNTGVYPPSPLLNPVTTQYWEPTPVSKASTIWSPINYYTYGDVVALPSTIYSNTGVTFQCISNITQIVPYTGTTNSLITTTQPIPGPLSYNTPFWKVITTTNTSMFPASLFSDSFFPPGFLPPPGFENNNNNIWNSDVIYYYYDKVILGPNNSTEYRCELSNKGFYPPTSGSTYWTIINSPTILPRPWSAGLSFEFGSLTSFNGNTFQCISNITQSIAYSSNYSPTDTRNNQPIPGINTPYWNYSTSPAIPATLPNIVSTPKYYSSTQTYYYNDQVTLGPHSPSTYVCASLNIGKYPPTNIPTYWNSPTIIQVTTRNWAVGISYQLHDYVSFRNTIFTCLSFISQSANYSTYTNNPIPSLDTSNNQPIPGQNEYKTPYWQVQSTLPYNTNATWSAGNNYYYNDIVTNTLSSYPLGAWLCISGNYNSPQITLSNGTYWASNGTDGIAGSPGDNGLNGLLLIDFSQDFTYQKYNDINGSTRGSLNLSSLSLSDIHVNKTGTLQLAIGTKLNTTATSSNSFNQLPYTSTLFFSPNSGINWNIFTLFNNITLTAFAIDDTEQYMTIVGYINDSKTSTPITSQTNSIILLTSKDYGATWYNNINYNGIQSINYWINNSLDVSTNLYTDIITNTSTTVITSGSKNITLSQNDISNVIVNMSVTGKNIPTNSYITNINKSNNTITISNNATGTSSSDSSLNFKTQNATNPIIIDDVGSNGLPYTSFKNWEYNVAMSHDASCQTFVTGYTNGYEFNTPSYFGNIYVSTSNIKSLSSSYINWSQVPTSYINIPTAFNIIQMSSTGQYQTAAGYNMGGYIYVSQNYGVTWSSKQLVTTNTTFLLSSLTDKHNIKNNNTPTNFTDIAISFNGQYQTIVGYFYTDISNSSNIYSSQLAVPYYNYINNKYCYYNGVIFTSNDYGTTWIQNNGSIVNSNINSISTGNTSDVALSNQTGAYYSPGKTMFSSISMNSSGNYQIAMGTLGTTTYFRMFYSVDYGVTWFYKATSLASTVNSASNPVIKMNSDGTIQTFVTSNGLLYYSVIPTNISQLSTNNPIIAPVSYTYNNTFNNFQTTTPPPSCIGGAYQSGWVTTTSSPNYNSYLCCPTVGAMYPYPSLYLNLGKTYDINEYNPIILSSSLINDPAVLTSGDGFVLYNSIKYYPMSSTSVANVTITQPGVYLAFAYCDVTPVPGGTLNGVLPDDLKIGLSLSTKITSLSIHLEQQVSYYFYSSAVAIVGYNFVTSSPSKIFFGTYPNRFALSELFIVSNQNILTENNVVNLIAESPHIYRIVNEAESCLLFTQGQITLVRIA